MTTIDYAFLWVIKICISRGYPFFFHCGIVYISHFFIGLIQADEFIKVVLILCVDSCIKNSLSHIAATTAEMHYPSSNYTHVCCLIDLCKCSENCQSMSVNVMRKFSDTFLIFTRLSLCHYL